MQPSARGRLRAARLREPELQAEDKNRQQAAVRLRAARLKEPDSQAEDKNRQQAAVRLRAARLGEPELQGMNKKDYILSLRKLGADQTWIHAVRGCKTRPSGANGEAKNRK